MAGYVTAVMFDSVLTPWTVALQVLLSMGFFRQEYRSGLLFSSPGGLLDSGVKLMCLKSNLNLTCRWQGFVVNLHLPLAPPGKVQKVGIKLLTL